MPEPNRIINPNTRYTMQIVIDYDPATGDTQLQVRNRSGLKVSMLQVACLLSEHNATLIRSLVTGTTKMEKVDQSAAQPAPNGGDSNAS